MPKVLEKYRWRGKIVTKGVYEKRLAQRRAGEKRKKEETKCATLTSHQSEVNNEQPDFMEGRRIVEIKLLGQQLWCLSCKEVLSLENIVHETRRGLGSVYTVRCNKCLLLREVTTSKQHYDATDKRRFRFDVNSKSVLGVLNSGLEWTKVKKLFACMNIPYFDFKTFKRYEEEIVPAAENVAQSSRAKAAKSERSLASEHG